MPGPPVDALRPVREPVDDGFGLVPCPLCGEHDRFLPVAVRYPDGHLAKYGELYAGRTSSEWKVCGNCGFVQQNPRPSIAALNEFYLRSQYHAVINSEWRNLDVYLNFARGYYGEKIDYTLKHVRIEKGRAFDIGFGHGGALRLFRDRGWEVSGVEPDRNLFEFGTQVIGGGDLHRDILSRSSPLVSPVDVVFSNHTFEHVADLGDLMAGVARILKPGGIVFTCVPTYFANRSSMSLRWMNAAHYSLFTHHSLNQLFSHYGLEEVTHTYRGWRREIDDLWHVARLTRRPQDPSAFFEDARSVQRYVNVINPIRSSLLSPVYSEYPRRVEQWKAAAFAAKLLLFSPMEFFSKLGRRLAKGTRREPPPSTKS